MIINKKTSRLELAAIITSEFEKNNLQAVLVGGAVVSIYTDNEYESKDLDFISAADHKKIVSIMKTLGFSPQGKNFLHEQTDLSVEFPSGPLGLGDRVPVKPNGKIKINSTTVILLSPTQSVMDRLAWFYFNNDRQCLDQAVMVSKKQKVNIAEIKKWSIEEDRLDKFEVFLATLKK